MNTGEAMRQNDTNTTTTAPQNRSFLRLEDLQRLEGLDHIKKAGT